jgi:pimeloyl-ACP methyl ester carboxylesterase
MSFIETSDINIFYEIIEPTQHHLKNPETIVFHHGIGADPGIWRDWLPNLIDQYRVVLFEMRGYARSVDAKGKLNYSLEILTKDILNLIDGLGLNKIHLVGESIGGTISLNFAIQHSERVKTLTVCNGGHVGSSIERIATWQDIIDQKGIKGWSEEFMQNRFFPDALTNEKRAWFANKQESWTKEGILNPARVLAQTNLLNRLKEISCEVLIMHPDKSPFIPVGIAVDLFQNLRNARLQVFSHSKHGLPFSHSKQCSELLRKFLVEVNES